MALTSDSAIDYSSCLDSIDSSLIHLCNTLDSLYTLLFLVVVVFGAFSIIYMLYCILKKFMY